MNYPNDFLTAEWLDDEDKAKLMAVYSTVRCRDVIGQALQMLYFDKPNSSPFDYGTLVRLVIRACSLEPVKRLIGNDERVQEALDLLDNMLTFFDILNGDDFHTLLSIDKACQYGDDQGRYSPAIDRLFIETKSTLEHRLKSMELKPAS
ncbi:hypothetical protein SAMN05421747_10421 [Parapedobacter composti]|uniref:Uncharacterized protein n=1 Tax=Parapedobacter composti TaxID=623281 RepID=A0A1I1G892_9SPHI|nr:hypothetical protein [Parapedobacter composti]SFC07562.1 hypothetical protein SAMN05421747_10421 [Parapedobacter composti]